MGDSVDMHDLEAIDQATVVSVKRVKEIKQRGVSEEEFSWIFDEVLIDSFVCFGIVLFCFGIVFFCFGIVLFCFVLFCFGIVSFYFFAYFIMFVLFYYISQHSPLPPPTNSVILNQIK